MNIQDKADDILNRLNFDVISHNDALDELLQAIAKQRYNKNVLFPNKYDGWTIQSVVQDIINEI